MGSRFVIYARVSTNLEEQDSSIKFQTTDFVEMICNQYPDFVYIGTYVDRESGTSSERPQFQKMIHDAKLGAFDIIFTKSVSRFARNLRIQLNVLQELKEYGVRVIFTEENIDSFDPTKMLYLNLAGTLAEQESRNTSQHLRQTYNSKRRLGKLGKPFACCYGYKYNKGTQEIEVVPEEIEVVKQIFDWFLQNMSTGKIAALLTDKGIGTPYGKQVWCRPQITKILKSEKYIGNASERDTSTGEVFHFENVYPQTIPVETFYQVQEVIKSRTKHRKKRTKSSLYALSGLCECSLCGRHAIRYGNHKNTTLFDLDDGKSTVHFWGCYTLNNMSSQYRCSTYVISEQYIYEAIIDALATVACGKAVGVSEGMLAKNDFSAFVSAVEESNKSFESELANYEARKKYLEKRRAKELDLFRDDIISKEDLKVSLAKIDKDIASLQAPKTPETKLMNKKHLADFLRAVESNETNIFKKRAECRKHLYELFKDADFKRSVVTTFVEKIYIGGEPKYTCTVELKNGLYIGEYHFKHRSPYTRNGKITSRHQWE